MLSFSCCINYFVEYRILERTHRTHKSRAMPARGRDSSSKKDLDVVLHPSLAFLAEEKTLEGRCRLAFQSDVTVTYVVAGPSLR